MTSTYIERLAKSIKSRVPPELVPEQGDVDSLFLIYAALGLAKGADVDRRDVHNAWAAWMAAAHPEHKSIKPYDELALETKQEDDPFVAAIRAAVNDHDR